MDQLLPARDICNIWWQLHGSDFKKGHYLNGILPHEDQYSDNSQCRTALCVVNHLMSVVDSWRSGRSNICSKFVRDRVLVVLFQCLVRLLVSQNENGSWGHAASSTSETASAIQCISQIARLSISQPLGDTIQKRLLSAECWLQERSSSAAPYIPAGLSPHSIDLTDITTIPFDRLVKLEAFYASLPHFNFDQAWFLRASLIEGYLFWPTLKSSEHLLYNDKDESKWLEYITFVLASNNNKAGCACSTEVLLGLMVQMSLLYQIDSFMEGIMPTYGFSNIKVVYQLVDDAFWKITRFKNADMMALSRPMSPPHSEIDKEMLVSQESQSFVPTPPSSPSSESEDPISVEAARSILNRFVTHLLSLPAVANASPHDRFWFASELRDFFVAQTRQVEEKMILKNQGQSKFLSQSLTFSSPKGTYYRWAHTTGSGSVGSPYLFAFMSCMLGNGNGNQQVDCWSSAEEKYLIERMSQHLAVMCRIENDVGGIRRDRVDCTVNSVNFPEFAAPSASWKPQQKGDTTPRDRKLAKTLLRLAQHEREAWQRDFQVLEELARDSEDESKMEQIDRLRLFTGFITLYGEIYVARDPWLVRADD